MDTIATATAYAGQPVTPADAVAAARAWAAGLTDFEVIGHYLTAIDEERDTLARLTVDAVNGDRPTWSTTTAAEWATRAANLAAYRTAIKAVWSATSAHLRKSA